LLQLLAVGDAPGAIAIDVAAEAVGERRVVLEMCAIGAATRAIAIRVIEAEVVRRMERLRADGARAGRCDGERQRGQQWDGECAQTAIHEPPFRARGRMQRGEFLGRGTAWVVAPQLRLGG
jgi:hypothetical protein